MVMVKASDTDVLVIILENIYKLGIIDSNPNVTNLIKCNQLN